MKMLQVSKCLIGLAVVMLQSCDVEENRRDLLCGNWESVEGKPDVLIGNLFMNTGFRIDVSYNEATDVLTFSPNGDYVRVKPQRETPIEEQEQD